MLQWVWQQITGCLAFDGYKINVELKQHVSATTEADGRLDMSPYAVASRLRSFDFNICTCTWVINLEIFHNCNPLGLLEKFNKFVQDEYNAAKADKDLFGEI